VLRQRWSIHEPWRIAASKPSGTATKTADRIAAAINSNLSLSIRSAQRLRARTGNIRAGSYGDDQVRSSRR